MAVELAKINRWAVTGTPLSSSFDDLVSQLYFIELEPFMTVKRPYLCGNQNFTARSRDACSMARRCRFLTARPSQDVHVIAEK